VNSETRRSRQQLVVLQRRHPRPRLNYADRRLWILASRWFSDWRNPLLIVETGNSSGPATSGLEDILEVAISSSKRWSPGDPGRASSSDQTHGRRESPLGSKAHPGRGQIYGSVSQPRPNRDVARVPDATMHRTFGLATFSTSQRFQTRFASRMTKKT